MGTQQILLIVLSVIIVGVAIAVGITMFGNQAYNSNQQALAAELTQYASLCMQYWKTPLSMGGAGQDENNVDIDALGAFLGFTYANSKVIAGHWAMTTDNGECRVTSVSGDTVEITGLGKETKGTKHPYIITTVVMSTGGITSSVSAAEEF